VGLFEAFYSSMKPVVLLNYNFEVQSGTKLPNGITELPFEFELKVCALPRACACRRQHSELGREHRQSERSLARARVYAMRIEHVMLVCRTTSLLRGVPAVLATPSGRDSPRLAIIASGHPSHSVSLFSL
jgi:hypothetical protein